jgi:N-dimethylarginine dimethylaminohydrolase
VSVPSRKEEGAEQVAEFVRAEGWDVEVAPIPALFVHMDGLVVPLDHKLLVACLDALEGWVIDWLRSKGFEFVDVGFAEARDLGVNLVSLGNNKVLSMAGSARLNQDLRARGYEVYAPDMSMFTLGGGGVHCLCQALRRDSVAV